MNDELREELRALRAKIAEGAIAASSLTDSAATAARQPSEATKRMSQTMGAEFVPNSKSTPAEQPTDATLLPCPRCGNRAFIADRNSVWCVTDRCLRLPPRETEAEAIAAWNTRTMQAAAPTPNGEGVDDRAFALYRQQNPEGFKSWEFVEGKDYWRAKATPINSEGLDALVDDLRQRAAHERSVGEPGSIRAGNAVAFDAAAAALEAVRAGEASLHTPVIEEGWQLLDTTEEALSLLVDELFAINQRVAGCFVSQAAASVGVLKQSLEAIRASNVS